MLGRNLKTELPVSDEQLKPEWPDFEHVLRNHNDAKKKSVENFNRANGARPLPPLHVGQDVRVRNNLNKSWSEKTTVDGHGSKSSILVRNRRHLQACPPVNYAFDFPPDRSSNDEERNNIIEKEITRKVNNTPHVDLPNTYHTSRYGRNCKKVDRYGY